MKQSTIWFHMMMYITGSLMLAACVIQPVRAIQGSGVVVTQVLQITQFDRVDVRNAFQVDIRQGDGYRVVVEVDEAVVPYLQVVRQGNALQIGLQRGIGFRGNVALRAEVTMPTLTGVGASGASMVSFDGFRSTADMAFNASGASSLQGSSDGGNMQLTASGASNVLLSGSYQDTTIEASGASRITLTGAGQNATINGSGGSMVDMAEFPVENASINASGASRVTAYPRGTLDASASGGSTIAYIGNPTLGNIQATGGSSVRPQ